VNFETKDQRPKACPASGAILAMRRGEDRRKQRHVGAKRRTRGQADQRKEARRRPRPTARRSQRRLWTGPCRPAGAPVWRRSGVAARAHSGAESGRSQEEQQQKRAFPGPVPSSRLSTKNRNRVEVTATGVALTSAISSRRRAIGSVQHRARCQLGAFSVRARPIPGASPKRQAPPHDGKAQRRTRRKARLSSGQDASVRRRPGTRPEAHRSRARRQGAHGPLSPSSYRRSSRPARRS
jgi:hypothetical protein